MGTEAQDQKWVVAITGGPATGKSALAARLVERFGWPLVTKDGIKETLFETLGTGDRSWSRRLSDASFALLFRVGAELVRQTRVALVEGNFREPEHFDRLGDLAQAGRARLLVIELCASVDTVRQRLAIRAANRDRHPGHLDGELVAEIPEEREASEQAGFRSSCVHWVTYDTDLLSESLLETIVAAVAARVSSMQGSRQ
jgi:predicted kinase